MINFSEILSHPRVIADDKEEKNSDGYAVDREKPDEHKPDAQSEGNEYSIETSIRY